MKLLILGTLLISAPTFAQNLDVFGLRQLMTSKKDTLESFRIGMTKKVTTNATAQIGNSSCAYRVISTQSILKAEGDKLIILNKEQFSPAATAACMAAGYEAYVESILYYENKPSLVQDLKDLDESASAIKSIVKNGNLVTMNLVISDVDSETNTTFSDNVTMKYDFSKSSFNNLISTQGNGYSIVSEDLVDVDLKKVDLKNVLFCENNDEDRSDCMEGDFSDILF